MTGLKIISARPQASEYTTAQDHMYKCRPTLAEVKKYIDDHKLACGTMLENNLKPLPFLTNSKT